MITQLQGLTESLGSLPSDTNVRVLALFDNEEVHVILREGFV